MRLLLFLCSLVVLTADSTKDVITGHPLNRIRLEFSITRNERAALWAVHAMSVHQADFAVFNCGYYDRQECLSSPGHCIRNIGDFTPRSFLLPDHPTADDGGYRYRLHLGGEGVSAFPVPCSSSGRKAFAYTAVPLEPGRTGRASFCIDNEQPFVCVNDQGTTPLVVNGVCRMACTEIRPLPLTLAELQRQRWAGTLAAMGVASTALAGR